MPMDFNAGIFKSIILVFTFHGFLLSALMAVGQLLAKSNSIKNLILFGLFIAFALVEFHYLLFEIDVKINRDYLDLLSITGFFLMGPLLYFLTCYSIKKNFKFTKLSVFHFVPAILSIILVLIVVRFLPVNKTHLLFGYFCNLWCFLIGILASLTFAVYLLVVGIIIYKNHLWHNEVLRKEPVAMVSLLLFCGFSSLTVCDILLVVTKNEIMMDVAIIAFTLIIITLFLINSRYPAFSAKVQFIVNEEKEKRTYLRGINLGDLERKINYFTGIKEIFTKDDISLPEFAGQLGISSHQLSEYMNKNKGMSFTSFINECRVNKAKILLKKKHNYTVLAVGFEVGFKSKSAFNSAFLKFTGITPGEYRKML